MERLTRLAGGQGPKGVVEHRFREGVPLEQLETILQVLAMVQIPAQDGGSEPVADDGEDAASPLGTVAGCG